jgi:tripartite-type tricarboxylate transporter receptor subunit TctC
MLRAALTVLTLLPFVCAAQSYPVKPLRVIVASSAGGPPDTVTRGAAEPLRQQLGQPLIIEDMPAADGIVAAQTVSRTAPDGYTLLVAAASVITLNPALYPKLPYDPRKDFAPVVMLAQFNTVFVANAAVPANSLRELIELAKAKPNSINFGTGGTSQTNNLYVEWLRNARNVPFYNVPYKRNPPALAATAAGEVHATTFALGGASALAKAGKVKLLALIGHKRLASHPDLPVVTEEGVDMVIGNWLGIFAPAGTPPDVVQRVNGAVAKVLADRNYVDKILAGQGLEPITPSGESPEAFARFLDADLANYARVIREARIKPD